MTESPANEIPESATLRPPCHELPPRRPRRRTPQPRAIVIVPKRRRTGRGERLLMVAKTRLGGEQHPMIRLRGRWLAELGFTADARIAVTEERGRLVLTLARGE